MIDTLPIGWAWAEKKTLFFLCNLAVTTTIGKAYIWLLYGGGCHRGLTLLHSEWPKLNGVLAILSAIGSVYSTTILLGSKVEAEEGGGDGVGGKWYFCDL